MRCGRDVDTGGNVQNGCGNGFSWASAPRYEAKPPEVRPVLEEFGLDRLELLASPTLCEVEPGLPLLCDGCQEPLVGARFRCLHCPSFECCMRCEMNISLGQTMRHEERNHVFHISLELHSKKSKPRRRRHRCS